MAGDALEEIAELIAAVGRCYQSARRYRVIADLCEERILPRALEAGSTVREAARSGGLDAATVDSLAEGLQALLAECREAMDGIHRSELYGRAARAWNAGRPDEVAALAPAIFTAVESYPECPTLYHPVPLAQRRGGGEHFIAPAACAETIVGLACDGIEAVSSDLGTDELIQGVFLSEDPDLLESPVSLAIEPASLPFPACHLVDGDAVLYVARLHAPFRVCCAATVTDEWWAVRPAAYARYVDLLRTELAARAIPIEERAT